MITVFDERDDKYKILTDVEENNKYLKKILSTINDEDVKITITKADEPIMPRINKRGNITLTFTKFQFEKIEDLLKIMIDRPINKITPKKLKNGNIFLELNVQQFFELQSLLDYE